MYSSDFPYFRIENPGSYIGILVDDDLKKNWELSILGDQFALPEFANKVDTVDILHYDSDKSYAGREFALRTLEDNFNQSSIVILDDIQDFKDWVEQTNQEYKVFEFQGKYIGLVDSFKK